jgi:hypothetical protein
MGLLKYFGALILCLIGVAMFGIGIWSQYQIPDLFWIAAFVFVVAGLWVFVKE